jgi:hypothetical protein
MKPTKDAMMPRATPEEDRTSEAYSEGGLSGEAALDVKLDTEPFMLRQHSYEELSEYDKGFECGQSGGQNDDTKSEAWQRGWAEAQE